MKPFILLFVIFSALSVAAQQRYITERDVSYYDDSVNRSNSYISSQCKLDVYYPPAAKDLATIVWFHGGSLTSGDKEIPKQLMDKGMVIVSVEYRFSPKVAAPAYIEDAAAAVAWVFKHLHKFGGNKKLVFLSGHSAGGYLALMITLDKKYLNKYGIDANDLAATIPFSGQAITHFTVRQEHNIKSTQPVIDEYAPLYHVRADAPPIVLITGDRELELLGRYEENAYLWRMMALAGHKKTTLFEMAGFNHNDMPLPAYPLLFKQMAAIEKKVRDTTK